MEMNFRLIVRYFVVQEKVASGDIVTIDENGTDIGGWRNLRWIA